MQRFFPAYAALMLVFGLLLGPGPATAQSPQAAKLRQSLGLIPYVPPKAFLDGFFIADEGRPAYLFGPVGEFAASRACKTSWLIEDSEKERLDKRDPANPVFEYTLYLEQDCPDGLTDFVFLDQSAMNPKQWIEWRRQFHKNKAEPEYADAVKRLEKAIADGFPVAGELRFVLRNGDLDATPPQELLATATACPPRYDCSKGEPVAR